MPTAGLPHDLRLAPAARLRSRRRRAHGAAHEGGRLHRHRQDQHARSSASARTPSTRCSARRATPTTRRKSAGGSSGGAAVALAPRMLPVADGSDSMGSLRNPAAWNNVFGFRPSQGRCPAGRRRTSGSRSFGTEGPMARTVRDLALLLDVQAGYDARRAAVARQRGVVRRPGLRRRRRRRRRVRIGWLGDLGGHLADRGRHPRRLHEPACTALAAIGCAIEPIGARLRARAASGTRG